VARKVITIVFADLAGSTALHERLDAESARRLMDRYYRTLHAAIGNARLEAAASSKAASAVRSCRPSASASISSTRS